MLFFIIIILFIIISSFSYLTYINGHNFYENRIKNNKINPKVFDIGHKYLPNLTENNILLIILNTFVSLSPFIIHFIFGYPILPEFIYYSIIIYLIRMIMINITILPKEKKCYNHFDFFSLFNGHCYDKIFSGHFASIFLLILILYKNNIITNIPVLSLYAIFNAIFILLIRSHYTIDIIVALFVVILVYFNIPFLKF